jgi:hypothetical protein
MTVLQQMTIYNFYRLNAPLKFPQALTQNELFVNSSFSHSHDWTLTELTQLLISLSTIHGLFHSMNINSIGTQHIICIEPQYLNQPPRSRPPSRFLFTSTTAHHHTLATQPPDMLHTSSAKSRVQHLAKTAPTTPVEAKDKHSKCTK